MTGQNAIETGQNDVHLGGTLPGASTSTRNDQRRTRKPEEVGQILGVGRNGVYELIRTGQLRSISVGRKILIPLEAIDEFLERPAR